MQYVGILSVRCKCLSKKLSESCQRVERGGIGVVFRLVQ